MVRLCDSSTQNYMEILNFGHACKVKHKYIVCERSQRLIGHVHMTPEIFEITHFPLRIRVLDGALNRSKERFQNCTVSVSGFVRTDGQFVQKVCSFRNIRIRVDVPIVFTKS